MSERNWCALLLLASPACSSGGPAPAPEQWPTVLSSVEDGGRAIYSYRFTGALPQGAYPHLAIHVGDSVQACGRYGSADTGPNDYWFIDVDLSSSAAGTYAIVDREAIGASGSAAKVVLLHRLNGTYAAAYPAVAGEVVAAQDLSIANAKAGKSPVIDLRVEFPTHAIQRLECRSGQAVGSTQVTQACDCRDSSGALSVCVPHDAGVNCCVDTSAGTTEFRFHAAATPCAAMCRQVAGLDVDYCGALQ